MASTMETGEGVARMTRCGLPWRAHMKIDLVTNRNRWRRRVAGLLPLIAAIVLAPLAHAADDALIVGVFPRLNASETTTRYAPLADHLARRLGRKVSLVTSKDFQSFWQAIEEQRYDIVQYNQYHYIRSAKTY